MKSLKTDKTKKEQVKNNKKNDKNTQKIKVKKQKGHFFKDVIKELKKVNWPDKKYMVKYSIATFATIIVSSIYFYAIFALFSLVKGLR